MKIQGIVCPVSIEKIDSKVSRLTVFLNVILMGFFIYTKNPLFIGIVAADYFIRAIWKMEYSPLRYIAFSIISALKLPKKPINLAQKVFASRLGVICALTSLILQLLGYTTGALIVAGILMALSFMDSVMNFCVGCIIYNYIVYPFYKDKD
ncbi:DUF4395 family protein [Maribellus comscasis]|uniref:DUF4395 family protein n=1 Tax=Maribellus comscasis TaxID=2681766 RepID=A0A6I6JWU2_9BACT|nr:DUF4395 domain-containing protein [Maribellus comscasis]QGY44607.1 DUF4395 family protein [Maribellus comscasis]